MNQIDLYGPYRETMTDVMRQMVRQIEAYSKEYETSHGEKLYEHLTCRIKSETSMIEKLQRNGEEVTAYSALRSVTDSIGIRIVSLFIDDIYENVRSIKALPNCVVVREKDYIRDAKPNGYRSYHMILDVNTASKDVDGNIPGHYFVEIQLRTIAMDTWAALEHEMKYKKSISNQELFIQELRRCANELAACDVSMQTLKRIIREG